MNFPNDVMKKLLYDEYAIGSIVRLTTDDFMNGTTAKVSHKEHRVVPGEGDMYQILLVPVEDGAWFEEIEILETHDDIIIGFV